MTRLSMYVSLYIRIGNFDYFGVISTVHFAIRPQIYYIALVYRRKFRPRPFIRNDSEIDCFMSAYSQVTSSVGLDILTIQSIKCVM